MRRRNRFVMLAGCAAAVSCVAGAAGAETTVVAGNGFVPRFVPGPGDRDPAGLSPYRLPGSRSPAGLLYDAPSLPREPHRTAGGWEVNGFVEAGVRATGGDDRNAAFLRYRADDRGARLERYDAEAVHAGSARFVELRGGAVGTREQFHVLQFGRINDWRVGVSFSETPHLWSTTARPVWQGVGSGELRLTKAPGVAAGGASTNNVANAAALLALVRQTPDATLGLVRRSGAARVELRLAEGWTFASSYTIERRQGARAFGGNAGNGETIEPIDHKTHELRAQLQYADETTQFNVALAGSLFRNEIDTLSWENPFLHTVGALRIRGGRIDLVPDNDAWRAKAEFARALPLWRGRFTATVELAAMRQNDRLIPPTATSGLGVPYGSGFDGNYDLWNTTAALSRERAGAAIDTRFVDLALALAPLPGLSLRMNWRHFESDNRTRYTAFNPLTQLYGYIIQDTNPSRVFDGTNNVHYRSIPFAGAQDTLRLAGEYGVRRRAVLGAELLRDEVRREHRERARTWEDRLRLSYTDRGFEALTLRLSYERARRRGSEYVSDPYREFFTETLPQYRTTPTNLLDRLYNLAELRKFDLADRDQQLASARINVLPRDDLDIGVTLRSLTNDYPAAFGRSGTEARRSAHLDVGWLPTPKTSLHADVSREWSRLPQASAADLGGAAAAGCLRLPPSCSNSFGAPRSIYPAALYWSAEGRDRSTSVSVGVRHDFGRPKVELQYTQQSSRSPLGYTFASADALQTSGLAAQAGDRFPDIVYSLRALDAALRLPLTPRLGMRLAWRYEKARIADWHYSGLEQGTVVGTRYYLDAGPSDYRAHIVGVFVQFSL